MKKEYSIPEVEITKVCSTSFLQTRTASDEALGDSNYTGDNGSSFGGGGSSVRRRVF